MKVISKQTNSQMCIICGMENPFGVKAAFYNMEDGSVVSLCKYKTEHRSYPLRVHGGLITALLDELAGRTIWHEDETLLGVTMTLNMKFRKPVPYGVNLIGVGKLKEKKHRTFVAEAKLYDENKNLLAECEATYMILSNDKIVGDASEEDDYFIEIKDDVKEIDLTGISE